MFTRWLRFGGGALVVAIVAGACGSATTSPTASSWPSFTSSPIGQASPTASPAAGPTPLMSTAPEGYPVAFGKGAMLAPAADSGTQAGAEINDFAFDLLRRLDAKGNLCASPTSIALALAMVRPGAKGVTAAQMDQVLHSFGSTSQASETVAFLQALAGVTFYDDSDFNSSDPKATPDHSKMTPVVELDVSNAVFAQQGMTLQPAYLDSLSSVYGAGVGLVDYQNNTEAARLAINKWGNLRTKGRIPNILSPGDIDSSTRITLANAIYFKAIWDEQFDVSATKKLSFTRADGSKVSVPTMAMQMEYMYGAGTGYRSIKIPSNGLMYSYRNYAEEAVDAGITDFNISFMAHTPELYARIMGKADAFALVTQGVRNLKALKRKPVGDLIIKSDTWMHLADIVEHWAGEGIDTFNLWLVSLSDRNKDNLDSLLPVTSMRDGIFAAFERGTQLGVTVRSRHIPICLLPGHESHMADLREDRVLVVSPRATFALWESKISPSAYTEKCSGCRYQHGICLGLRQDYLDRYGDAELRPALAEPVSHATPTAA